MSTARVNLGVVGLRGWGKNVVRGFSRTQHCDQSSLYDLNRGLRSTQHKLYPQAQASDQYETMLENADLNAVESVALASSRDDLAQAGTNPIRDLKREGLKLFAA